MKKRQFVILILLLIIGFASVTTTLVLNGKVGVGVELDDFDVIFIESLLDGKEDKKATISEDKKTITFSTERLSNKGESARLDYKVKNTSTQYNADVEINCTNEANEYVNVTSSFDGNQIPLVNPVNIKAQEVKSGYINAELIKAYAGEDTSVEIKCAIVVTATSRETYAYSLNFNSNGGSSIDDKSVVLNEEYGALEEPVREGYTFLGWYDEEDNKVFSSTILDSKGNRNLKAKWEEKIYDLNIVTQKDGNSTTNKVGITYGNKVTIKINEKNYYISSIECSDGYSIEDYELVIPTYGEQVINIKNNNKDKEGTCTFTLEQGIFEYGYTGREQSFVAPLNGEYKIELWGASGSYYSSNGGMGAYTSGLINMTRDLVFYIQVGSQGTNGNIGTGGKGGYNGGASAQNSSVSAGNSIGGGGGGATDVRLVNGTWNNFSSLKSRIMVASGGGGSGGYGVGGHAGTLNGYHGTGITGSQGVAGYGYGASQTAGGNCYISTSHSQGGNCSGAFGYANTTTYYSSTYVNPGSGGGGGYYGGGSSSTGIAGYAGGAGGGGSSFISGYTGCNAIAESSTSSKIIHTGQPNHYSGYVFTNTIMIAGNASMPNYSGTSTMTGNSGNGYAKITLVSID